MTKVPDFRAAKAEFTSYIAGKSRYVSVTGQQGPLRDGEVKLRTPRRRYIKQTMQWDAEGLCWRNKDGRPLIIKDLIWDTVISEMRQLDTHGQRLVWTTVKAKFDGILEDDVRMICQVWYKHGLSQLNRRIESQWTLYGDNVELAAPSSIPSPIRRSQSGDSVHDDESSQDEQSSSDDKSSQDDEPPGNGESSKDNEPPLDCESSDNDGPLQEDEFSEANESPQAPAQIQDEDLGRQLFKCVLIPPKNLITNKNPPKRRRANSTEKLQKYTEKLMENYTTRPSRRAKNDIDGLRGIGAGIYASNTKPFAQEAAERMARTRQLAEFVDNASPVAPKGTQETAPKKRLRPRSPSSTPADDDSDKDDDDNDDDDDDDDEDEGDWERVRPDPELNAKHRRLLMAMGHDIGQQTAHGGQQTAHGPMYA